MPVPKELRLIVTYDDGAIKEARYALNPLRSGDNPHQAGYIGEPGDSYTEVIEGRGMGFTNHLDLVGYSVAVEISRTMAFLGDNRTEAVVVNKHTNPAVYAARASQAEALAVALTTDKKSPFGGVMCASSRLTRATTQFLLDKNEKERFVLDVLAAPGFEEGCAADLADAMKNLRIIDLSAIQDWDKINSGFFGLNMKWTIGNKPVITEADRISFFNAGYGMETLSKRKPTDPEWKDAHLAWVGAKAVQSNSFAFCRDGVLLAQCGGQPNREDSAKFAHERAGEFGVSLEESAAATDSFIFDRSAIDLLREMRVGVIVHPTRKLLTTGYLSPDKEIIKAVDEAGMVMLRPHLIAPAGQEKPWRVFRHL